MRRLGALTQPRAPIVVDGSVLTLFAIVATFFVLLAPMWVWVTVNCACLAIGIGIYAWRRHRQRT